MSEELKKEEVINKLTLIDTADYRRRTNPLQKEPPLFRTNLSEVYSNLDIEDLKILLELKQK
tara:strand:+ start:113 stop:298 length:186 start_codon:yes stop_codon:yes gene_type:complete